MGQYVNTERTCVPGDEVSGGCGWCGQHPRRLFSYSATRYGAYFCNVGCAESWSGESFPRPIQPAAV